MKRGLEIQEFELLKQLYQLDQLRAAASHSGISLKAKVVLNADIDRSIEKTQRELEAIAEQLESES